MSTLEKVFELIDLNLEDTCKSAENIIKKHIDSKYEWKINTSFKGVKITKDIFKIRHEIVHEGKTTRLDDFQLNTVMLFIQQLAVILASRFSVVEYSSIEKIFDLKKVETEDKKEEKVDPIK